MDDALAEAEIRRWQAQDAPTRGEIRRMLMGGLVTEADSRPAATSDEVNEIVARLQAIDRLDLKARLVAAGLLPRPYAITEEGLVEGCESCMYFEKHRRYCNLPELAVPVEPEWSCRLWRI